MFKNFSLLLLLVISFSAHSAQEEKVEESQVKPVVILKKHSTMAPPSDEDDIQPYEAAYGKLPQSMKNFYVKYGNCSVKYIDIHHIYGGKDSSTGRATGWVRKYLPNYYHVFAFDQGAGGYWVYDARETNIVFELFDTSFNTLRESEEFAGLFKLLSKYREID